MADFRKMIPFILHSEEGIKKEYLNMPPEQIYHMAASRGVHVAKHDKGGPTMCGVTLSTYTEYRRKRGFMCTTVEDLGNMPYEVWLRILKSMFWNRWQADRIKNQMVACALVDWVWTSGRYGITHVQRLLHVVADGIVGPVTLAAVNNYPDQRDLFDRIQEARRLYFISISPAGSDNLANRKGWLNRLKKITWEGFKYDV